jgi:lysine-N-methylase
VRWIEASAAALLEPGACEEALFARSAGESAESAGESAEAFYLRAVIHGHHLVTGDAPLAGSLRDRAVRLLIARAMPSVLARALERGEAGAADPAARHPLALVEAMLRGHGLESYRSDIEEP